MKPLEVISVDKCPVCGCTETIFAKKAKQALERGLLKKDDVVALGEFALDIVNPGILPTLLIGSTVPHIKCVLDACVECKVVYAVKYLVGEAEVAKIMMPKPPPGDTHPLRFPPKLFG